jgi:hypothetical protein
LQSTIPCLLICCPSCILLALWPKMTFCHLPRYTRWPFQCVVVFLHPDVLFTINLCRSLFCDSLKQLQETIKKKLSD